MSSSYFNNSNSYSNNNEYNNEENNKGGLNSSQNNFLNFSKDNFNFFNYNNYNDSYYSDSNNNNNNNNNGNNKIYQSTNTTPYNNLTTTTTTLSTGNNSIINNNIPKFLINEIININDEFIELAENNGNNSNNKNNQQIFIESQPELYQYRLVSCKYCKEFVHFIELVSHRLRCQQILGKCNKCYNQLKSNEFQQHINQCPMNFSIVRYCENCGTALNSNTALKHTEKVCLETILHLNLSALEDSTNTQLNDEQKLKILKIKNDILSLSNSIKSTTNTSTSTTTTNNSNINNSSNNNNNNNNNIKNNKDLSINNQNSDQNNLPLTIPTPIPTNNNSLDDQYSIHVQPLRFHSQSPPPPPSHQQLKLQIQKRNETILNDDIKPFTNANDDLTREQINQLKLIIKSTPKIQSKKWALVNQIWYSKWEKGVFSKNEMGSISNHHLLEVCEEVNQLLRSDIKEGQDFTVVPLEVWKTFKEVYGGSPDIIRKVTDKSSLDLQIPITLFFIKSSDIKNCLNITKSHAFQNETFYALKKRICKIFHLALNDVELFNYDGGARGQTLHSFLSPKTIKLYNNQMILVEEKQFPLDSLEPSSIKSTSSSPTPSKNSSVHSNSLKNNIPSVIDFNDPRILEMIPKNTDYSPLFKHEITEYITDKGEQYKSIKGLPFYFPVYTNPFSLSLLNYSFFMNSFNYNPESILNSQQYLQFEDMQNNFDSNIDQIQSFSFGGNNNSNSGSSSDLSDTNSLNGDNNSTIPINNYNGKQQHNNTRVINSSDEIISPPLYDLSLSKEPPPPLNLEDQKKKSQQRPPQCKVN